MVFYSQGKTKQNIIQSKSNPIIIPSHDTMITRVTESQFQSNPTMIPIPIPNLIPINTPSNQKKQASQTKEKGLHKTNDFFFGFFGVWGGKAAR